MLLILAMAAATAAPGPDDAAVAVKNRADLQALYDQSCAVRAYGSFDDMCARLRQSIREYERDQAKAARDRARNPRPSPPPSPAAAAPAAPSSTALSLGAN